jgi:hypothetical protein
MLKEIIRPDRDGKSGERRIDWDIIENLNY